MKATQGNYYTDPDFAASWAAMKAAGVVRGAYHFLDPTVDGATQANFYLQVIGTLGATDLPAVLDMECPTSNDEPDSDGCLYTGYSGDATGAQITQAINDWITTIVAATGRKPLLYTYPDWLSDLGVDTTGFDSYPLWIADYDPGTCFDVPSPWTLATIWQYSDSGNIAGLPDPVDQDYFLGSLAQLTAFTGAKTDAGSGTSHGDAGTPAAPFTAPSQANGNDALSVVSWPDGHVELYATATSGTASRVDSTLADASNGDSWNAAVSLGGPASCGVASVFWAGGSGHTAEVFDGLSNGTTESLEYVASSSNWTSFASFGGVGLGHLSTLAYPDGHIEVFALADDGAIWHNVSTKSSWGGWQSMGAITGAFASGAGPILWNDGHGEIFAIDATGGAWHDATNTASPPVWGGWKPIAGGPLASRPIPARWADGHVQVFARGTDDVLYMSDSSSGVFAAFTALNPTQTLAGYPSVLVYPDYGPEIFARAASGEVMHMWNSAPDAGGATGSWSAWASDLNEVLSSDPLAWMRPDGLAEVFGVDGSGNLVKSLHDGPTWSAWATLGTGFDACVGGTKLVEAGVPTAGSDAAADAGTGPITTRANPDASAEGLPSLSPGCACRTSRRTSDTGRGAAFALLALGLVVARRRRKG